MKYDHSQIKDWKAEAKRLKKELDICNRRLKEECDALGEILNAAPTFNVKETVTFLKKNVAKSWDNL
jgi:hypothetical protein